MSVYSCDCERRQRNGGGGGGGGEANLSNYDQ